VVPLSDLAFIRTSEGATQRVTGRWQPQNEPLLAQNLPLAASVLATPIPSQGERMVTLGITAPTGQVTEVGLLTNWQNDAAQPIWFLLADDPTGPHQDAVQPPPPTPVVLGMEHGGGSGSGDGQGMWPTMGFITRGYGCHEFFTGIDGTGFGCPAAMPWFHNGVDIANVAGTAVWSPVDGTMVYAGPNSGGADCAHLAGSEAPHEGLGNYQRIEGAGTTHYLGHLQSFSVVGGGVSAGQEVAGMGSTGCSTGPHLHWMVYANGQLVDPAAWAGPGP
jgi:murein DD-endopeptidase MepM/ murein hydrolase activator NlpD